MNYIKGISNIPLFGVCVRYCLSIINAYIIPFFIRGKFQYLKSLKNKYKGKRCFIVATGPSLNVNDLELIKGEISFSCNSIVKILDKTTWRPDYYMMFDKDAYLRLKKDIYKNQDKLSNFFYPYDWNFKGKIGRPYVLRRASWHTHKQHDFLYKCLGARLRFSQDPSKVVRIGGNIVHIIMQFVYYMGFKEVYLLGCDCTFLKVYTHADGIGYQRSRSYDADWSSKVVMEDYLLERKIFTKMNIKIYNATRGGNLELFPRVKLEDVIKS
ncbi:MAG: DUF115 domain-containing protein [Prevotella sp.]|jgi:hypothetical protein|nr:DUF115 domain-containing protein [Prevotella sp.]